MLPNDWHLTFETAIHLRANSGFSNAWKKKGMNQRMNEWVKKHNISCPIWQHTSVTRNLFHVQDVWKRQNPESTEQNSISWWIPSTKLGDWEHSTLVKFWKKKALNHCLKTPSGGNNGVLSRGVLTVFKWHLRDCLICYRCSSYWFILCSWIIFKKFMVHFYGNSQSCISLVCIARSWRQEKTDGFSIIDANELPSVDS